MSDGEVLWIALVDGGDSFCGCLLAKACVYSSADATSDWLYWSV